jgi:hypothetical protein
MKLEGRKNKFLENCLLIHGNKYNYSKVDYKTNKNNVIIICSEHGEFEQSPDKHINRKQGCPKCAGVKLKTLEEFINKSKLIHGDKYDYSKVNYINNISKVIIICPIHGEFEQQPKSHLHGSGCPKCVGKNKSMSDIINEFKLIHGDKYDYSKVNYINPIEKLIIICIEHGEFLQTYNTHKNGHGCPMCFGNNKSNKIDFINKANKIHNEKYHYNNVEYINNYTKVNISCPTHGEFKQSPDRHLQGSGCPKCKGLKISKFKTKTPEEFICEAKLIHNNKYNYSLVNYIGCKEYITIICPEHGEFNQWPDSHLQGCGCPKCGIKYNISESQLKYFIKSLNIEFIENSRDIIKPLELDIFIPDKNIAIEFNGLYWHSELFKDNNYHLNKTNECNKKNIKLIHIFEDEWVYKKDIVKSRLKNILGLTENKIYGRKCIIKEVNIKDSSVFLNNNHIQGSVKSSINIGLYYNNELVSLMCFNKPRLGIGSSYDGYELSRFCNKLNTNVIGGASKLLKYFENNYQPKEIKSYADLRWSDGGLYNTLGFELSHTNKSNYWYIVNNKREYRFNYRKSILEKQGFDVSNKTEHQIMLDRKIYRVYDCGTISYKKTTT